MGLFKKEKSKSTPFSVGNEKKMLHKNLEFVASEQYRLLRTNIKFTLPQDVKCPVIGVTSSIRGEGKSTTSINLSYVLAEKGNKVLLIDGDLRIPSIAKKMGLENNYGLTDLLLGTGAEVEKWKSNINPDWYILTSGEIPPNPSELLGSKRMENVLSILKEHFDYIVIDLPPVNIVSDAMSVANMITGMLIVIREDYATKTDVEQCFRQVKLSNVNVLGCVMNGSDNGSGSYRKYGKYGKKYKYKKYYKNYRYQAYEHTPKGEKK